MRLDVLEQRTNGCSCESKRNRSKDPQQVYLALSFFFFGAKLVVSPDSPEQGVVSRIQKMGKQSSNGCSQSTSG